MTRAVIAVAAITATLGACAPDHPSAVVGIEAHGCRAFSEHGSGMFVHVDGVDEPIVLTSAHVVSGADRITVRRGGATGAGRVVAFDPAMDLAYLTVEGLHVGRPWRLAADTTDGGERGLAYVVRDGRVESVPVTVVRGVTIRTEDVYVEGETHRPGFELAGDIVRGDSGGAITAAGEVVGVVWARSRTVTGRAYAIDPQRAGAVVRAQLESGDLGDVDVDRCP